MSMRSFDEFESANDMRLVRRGSLRGMFSTERGSAGVVDGLGGLIFEGPLAERRAGAFGEIVEACSAWVERRPGLAAWLKVRPIVEVGIDFVAWEFRISGESLSTYSECYDDVDEFPPPVPPGLQAFLHIVDFFLGDDEEALLSDPALQQEEQEILDRGRNPEGFAMERERLEMVRRFLRESLSPDSFATSLEGSWRGDLWLIHSIRILDEDLDRWAELGDR